MKVLVRYDGPSKRVINRYGVFEKDVPVEVDEGISKILLKGGEFKGVEIKKEKK